MLAKYIVDIHFFEYVAFEKNLPVHNNDFCALNKY